MSIKEIHSCFFEKVTDIETFKESLSKLDKTKLEDFANACLLIKESEKIEIEPKIAKHLLAIQITLLFVAIETLMNPEKYVDFYNWFKSDKVEGKKEKNKVLDNLKIKNKECFRDELDKLHETYLNYYGTSRNVCKFFKKYIEKEDKKKLIKLFLPSKNLDLREIIDKDKKGFVPICYSKECFYRNLLMNQKVGNFFRDFSKQEQDILTKFNKEKCKESVSSLETFYMQGLNKEETVSLVKKVCNKLKNLSDKTCKLEDSAKLDKQIKRLANKLLAYYRNQFLHKGKPTFVGKEKLNHTVFCLDEKGKYIHIKIKYSKLKSIIEKGLTNYYKKEILEK